MLARVLSWLAPLARSDEANDVEILVLASRGRRTSTTQSTPRADMG
jgi:hypothetical protein